MGEECVFSLHTHYLKFYNSMKTWLLFFPCEFDPVPARLNNFSFASTLLATKGGVLPYNGKMAILKLFWGEKKEGKKRRSFAKLPAMPYLPVLIANKQSMPGIWRAEQAHLSNHMAVAAATSRTALLQALFEHPLLWIRLLWRLDKEHMGRFLKLFPFFQPFLQSRSPTVLCHHLMNEACHRLHSVASLDFQQASHPMCTCKGFHLVLPFARWEPTSVAGVKGTLSGARLRGETFKVFWSRCWAVRGDRLKICMWN